MTTVFIGMDANNNSLINASTDVSIAGKVFDATLPCPDLCDEPTRCTQYCDSTCGLCCKKQDCDGSN
jgi:hypothetical protein